MPNSIPESGLQNQVRQLETRVSTLENAFPGGDVEGHRRYHQLMIEQIEERRRLRIAIQEKTVGGLVWAAIVGLGVMLWQYLKVAIVTGIK